MNPRSKAGNALRRGQEHRHACSSFTPEDMMSRTAMLIIDAQIALLEGAYLADDVVAAMSEALRRARESKAPVIFLRHNHASFAPLMKGALSWEIDPRIAPQAGEVIIDKTASDSFWETELERVLKDLGIDRIAVAGLQTEFCVDATCRAALSRGFDVTVVADGHTTGDAVTEVRHHTYALTRLAHPTRSVVARRAEELEFN